MIPHPGLGEKIFRSACASTQTDQSPFSNLWSRGIGIAYKRRLARVFPVRTWFKVYGHNFRVFASFWQRRQLSWVHVCLSWQQNKTFQTGSTRKSKNLLLLEQILSFKSWQLRREAILKMTELFPPEGVSNNLKYIYRAAKQVVKVSMDHQQEAVPSDQVFFLFTCLK